MPPSTDVNFTQLFRIVTHEKYIDFFYTIHPKDCLDMAVGAGYFSTDGSVIGLSSTKSEDVNQQWKFEYALNVF